MGAEEDRTGVAEPDVAELPRHDLDAGDAAQQGAGGGQGVVLAYHQLDLLAAGTILTTRQCLLNPNRNRGWKQADAEAALAQALGARKVLWLGDGLMNDHTDGHVDNLARFIAPGVVACPLAFGLDDPNAGAYDQAAEALAGMIDADGRRLKVLRIPSPGRIIDEEHRSVPASHMNFLIANRAVIVPTYGDLPDGDRAGEFALEALQAVFPHHTLLGLPSRALLTGGGSFHCISQQEPAA